MGTENLSLVLAPSILYAQNQDAITSLQQIDMAAGAICTMMDNFEEIFQKEVEIKEESDLLPAPMKCDIVDILPASYTSMAVPSIRDSLNTGTTSPTASPRPVEEVKLPVLFWIRLILGYIENPFDRRFYYYY